MKNQSVLISNDSQFSFYINNHDVRSVVAKTKSPEKFPFSNIEGQNQNLIWTLVPNHCTTMAALTGQAYSLSPAVTTDG